MTLYYSPTLKPLVEGLMSAYTYHAGFEGFALCSTINEEGVELFYKVAFTVFRSEKKLRLHITSAYPVDHREKVKKVRFELLLKAALRGKPLPKPQA